MAYTSKGLLVCLIAAVGCLVAVYALLPTAPAPAKSLAISPQPPDPPLAETPPKIELYELKLSGRTVGSLEARENHRYHFHLVAGQFLAARVEQDPVPGQEVDVSVRLFGPVGGLVFEIDSPTANVGAEEVHLVAESTGWHQAEVDGDDKPGTYRIEVRAVRPASPSDRSLFQAEKLFHRARETSSRNCSQAVPGFLKAERLGRQLGRLRLRAEALRRAGECLSKLDKPREALPCQTEALDLYRKLGDVRAQIVQLNSLGTTYDQLADVEAREKAHREALKLAQEFKDPREEAIAWLHLSSVLSQKGEFWSAITACEKALAHWEQEGDWQQAIYTLASLGLIYISIGEYQMALDRYQQAEKLIPARQGEALRGMILSRYSEVLQKMGELERARPYATQAVALREKAGDLQGLGVSLAGLGLLYQQSGDFQQARDSQRRALEIFRRISYPRGVATAYVNLGLLSLAEEQAYEALRSFEQGLELARRLKYRDGETVAIYGMAYAERMRRNPINARAFAFEALKLVESLRKEAVREDLKASFLDAQQNIYDLLIDLLVQDPPSETPPADLVLSFEISERRRARSLLESFALSGRWQEVQEAEPQLIARLRRIDEEIDRRAEERQHLKSKGLPTDDVDSVIRSLFNQSRSAEIQVPDADRSDRQAPVTLSEAQGLLDEDTVLLEYFLGRKRSFLWLVTPRSAEVFVLPAGEQIELLAREVYYRLRESQTEFGTEQALEAARDLSETVLGPVANRLGKKRLVIVADGALHYVPFAVLPDPAAGFSRLGNRRPPFLIANHEIVNLPSASVLRELRFMSTRRAQPPGLLAIVTDPIFASGRYAPLTQSAREAEAILGQIPPDAKTLKLEGSQASRELVTSGRLASFRIVHFTTHGVIDTEIPELSGIVLSSKGAKDDHLRVRDVQRLSLSASLVVLSACNTARGKEMRGEGLVGLTHSFMHAGASAVVVSLWNVNEDSTPTFMKHFYHALLSEGRSPSAALRAAQLAMIRDPRWKSPYYWSEFIVQGEWRMKSPEDFSQLRASR